MKKDTAGYKQLHIAESEKGAHVTYFFNGGHEEPYDNEEHFIIPSPKVKNYSEIPEMSANIIRDETLYRIALGKYNFILVNFANPDMLGHTGNLDQTVKGIEIVDTCVGEIIKATIEASGNFVITADHGNCDLMIDERTGNIDTAHTLNAIPIIIGKDLKQYPSTSNPCKIGFGEMVAHRGILADVGVTALHLMNLSPTEEMVGIDLLPLIPAS